jgi:glutamine amidotransferase
LITIVDYDAGNLRSISNMLRIIGVASRISRDCDEIAKATKLILPGVGHFDFGMRKLRSSGLVSVLNSMVFERQIPLLGICLGAQLLTRSSEEGTEPGLAWIQADTVRFDRERLPSTLRVPHMGWAETEFRKNDPLFQGFTENPRFYYVHSYHMKCDFSEDEMCWGVHGYRFVSGICNKRVWGVQFHPEKSHSFGKLILKNFAAL